MVRKTRKGITCQKWNVNTPHRTKYVDHLSVTKTNGVFIQEENSLYAVGDIQDTGKAKIHTAY